MVAEYIETSHEIIFSALNWQPLGLVFSGVLFPSLGRYFRGAKNVTKIWYVWALVPF